MKKLEAIAVIVCVVSSLAPGAHAIDSSLSEQFDLQIRQSSHPAAAQMTGPGVVERVKNISRDHFESVNWGAEAFMKLAVSLAKQNDDLKGLVDQIKLMNAIEFMRPEHRERLLVHISPPVAGLDFHERIIVAALIEAHLLGHDDCINSDPSEMACSKSIAVTNDVERGAPMQSFAAPIEGESYLEREVTAIELTTATSISSTMGVCRGSGPVFQPTEPELLSSILDVPNIGYDRDDKLVEMENFSAALSGLYPLRRR